MVNAIAAPIAVTRHVSGSYGMPAKTLDRAK